MNRKLIGVLAATLAGAAAAPAIKNEAVSVYYTLRETMKLREELRKAKAILADAPQSPTELEREAQLKRVTDCLEAVDCSPEFKPK